MTNNSQVLITDEHFVPPGHRSLQLLEDAGLLTADDEASFRLPELCAAPEVLMEKLIDKVVYILGGIEVVDAQVIAAAPRLKVIAFTGSGYELHIPAWRDATKRGIAITAARGRNAESVAEWSLASALALVRDIPHLTAPLTGEPSGGTGYSIAREFKALTFGIVGYGAIGHRLAQKAALLGFRVLSTDSVLARAEFANITELDAIVAEADIISVHVSRARGRAVLDARAINALKSGAIVINAAFDDAIDNTALLKRLLANDIKAAVDYPIEGAEALPPWRLLASNAQTAFNTLEANDRVSLRTAEAAVNVMRTGFDRDLVNPEYLAHR